MFHTVYGLLWSKEQQLRHLAGGEYSCFITNVCSLDPFPVMIQTMILGLQIGDHHIYTENEYWKESI